ncbi:histone acetyltransferase HAC1-like isoform X2 [Amaranthus tricolor]|uniref:histone acetyltransferase HAC1-like isoform X2 n=1 Tax=Amaranthus tricolor TaxID=29722 RepID=UPI00258F85FC|nr:histone acetyltransferase HAC1-like isoform X2 [Amaranthus tricolor]
MNIQTRVSGQISGQVPNQASNQLPGIPQQNGNTFYTQVQNLVGQSNPSVMDPEVLKIRRMMQDRIYQILMQKQPQSNDIFSKKLQELSKRLEEGLFKSAPTKEEYMNLSTLESRLQTIIKRIPQSNHAPQPSQFMHSSTPVGTMIPTPGMQQQHNVNSNVMASSTVDPSNMITSSGSGMSSSIPGTGGFMPNSNGPFSDIRGGSFHGVDGSLSNGYQQSPSSFPMNSSNSNLMTGQRVMSQMIPTPGFSSNNNNQTLMNVDNSSNGGVLSCVDPSGVSQQGPQKHVGQNSRMLQNLGSAVNNGMRSSMQSRFQNGSVNSGFGNNVQLMNSSGSSDGYLTTQSFGASSRPLQQSHDSHQRPAMQGDGYRIGATDSTGSGNFYNTGSQVASLINNQGLDQMKPQSRSNSLMSQTNAQGAESASYVRPQLTEQYQQQTHLLPQQQQIASSHQQKQSSDQQQPFGRIDQFSQVQTTSDLGSRVKSEAGIEHPSEVLQSQIPSGQLQYPDSHSQLLNANGNLSRISQSSSVPSMAHDMHSTLLQNSRQVIGDEATNEYGNAAFGVQSDALLHSQWHSEAERPSLSGNVSNEQHVQEEFRQRIVGHDEAQCNNLSSDVSNFGQTVASQSAVDQARLVGASNSSGKELLERQYRNQQRWLLFLRHARGCRAPVGKCLERTCPRVQNLLKHIENCHSSSCPDPRCRPTKTLINHHRQCRDQNCPVCIPVYKFIHAQRLAFARKNSDSGLQRASCRSSEVGESKVKDTLKPSEVIVKPPENQPALKRLKTEPPSQSVPSESGSIFVPVNANKTSLVSQSVQLKEFEKNDNSLLVKCEFPDVKIENPVGSNPNVTEVKNTIVDTSNQPLDGTSFSAKEESVKVEKDNGQVQPEEMVPSETGTKSGKPKIKGVSLTELFTPEQIREHITGLRQWVGQSKAKAEKNQAMEHSMSENSCQLCAVEKLTFEPPPIYCTPCGARIKRNAMYYTVGAGDTRHYFCIPCYNEARGDTVVIDGNSVLKARLEKKKNDEETEEWWVQCDKCEAWQHQICALFNGRRNDGGQAEYTCPFCYMQEVERGERVPLPQSAVLGAKDLPKTILSDHIEHRLFKRLKHERTERARVQGKSYDEVPGADGIVVRVVSSVDKKLEVKPRFLEIFREENYPTEFPYKSKVVLLFQKIEGVEVCLFGMYVQEFGSESLPPNQRRVYLSYLDSVKYFRPDVKAVTGEALRTFVYHEILIGYLEYCKKRGFTSCYIWACPPLKGEDYILYCHPEIQKTPKSDKLREWYLAMLRKASKENIVVELTNLFDHFFTQTGECKAKVTAARLPYFDGDYWPGAAEDMIYQINQEEEGRKLNKKGIMKKTITKRALKATGQTDLSSNASKDILLMHKLGETISPMKEDFIMVHLQHACTHCCLLMVSGNRWVCNQCKNFQLCDKCYEAEQKRDDRERHPINQKDKHPLFRSEITDVPDDTKDKDEILESEFFDTRQAFLSLCQGNHYQYDTLRRAKHSSMMVLYHLHNPTAPAFVITCNICHLDIETGQGWRCETCPDYDICNSCYQKDEGNDHPHKLTNHPSLAERDAQNKEARQLRVVQLRKMLDLLVHASQCRSPHCQYPNCRKVKGLFRHGIQCRVRASGGCVLCKKMWYLLQLHARACKESECHVPRCRDLKEHLRRLQQQSDSRRRAAVMEMMRQRAAEVAGNSG